MADSYNKKEREKKRRKRKQDKAERKRQKKIDGVKSAEFMYVDEDGNLTHTPPDPSKKRKINAEDIELGVPKGVASDQPKFAKTGLVKFYNSEKGYGFIQDTATGKDYFVHADSLEEDIQERDKVIFEIGAGPKGPVANKVKLYREKKAPEKKEEDNNNNNNNNNNN